MDSLTLNLNELLALAGLVQCTYVLVYMVFRAGTMARAGLAIAYFAVLGAAFYTSFAHLHLAVGGDAGSKAMFYAQWLLWFTGLPLSYLLIVQICRITHTPPLAHYTVLMLIPLALVFALLATHNASGCETWHSLCEERRTWLNLTGVLAGALSLLALWFNRRMFEAIYSYKSMARERYWLVLALILSNAVLLGLFLIEQSPNVAAGDIYTVRLILALVIAYLVGTSLFRIYPQAIRVQKRKTDNGDELETLSDEEMELALKVERLITLDKIYQEPGYSRSDLARECGVSEASISRIVNVHFQKPFPQLMNEHKVKDAKQLLVQTEAPVKMIATDVGFNSLATFNRVFKEMTGESPGNYRKKRA